MIWTKDYKTTDGLGDILFFNNGLLFHVSIPNSEYEYRFVPVSGIKQKNEIGILYPIMKGQPLDIVDIGYDLLSKEEDIAEIYRLQNIYRKVYVVTTDKILYFKESRGYWIQCENAVISLNKEMATIFENTVRAYKEEQLEERLHTLKNHDMFGDNASISKITFEGTYAA